MTSEEAEILLIVADSETANHDKANDIARLLNRCVATARENTVAEVCRYLKHNLNNEGAGDAVWAHFKRG